MTCRNGIWSTGFCGSPCSPFTKLQVNGTVGSNLTLSYVGSSSASCYWLIVAPEPNNLGLSLQVRALSVASAGNNGCNNNYLSAWDGLNGTVPSKICTTPTANIPAGRSMWMQLNVASGPYAIEVMVTVTSPTSTYTKKALLYFTFSLLSLSLFLSLSLLSPHLLLRLFLGKYIHTISFILSLSHATHVAHLSLTRSRTHSFMLSLFAL